MYGHNIKYISKNLELDKDIVFLNTIRSNIADVT